MSLTLSSFKGLSLPEIKINNGTLEVLKWSALILMTGDHINKFIFNASLPLLFEFGRLAMPIFVFVIAYNLARPRQLENMAHRRAVLRLATFGAAAMPSLISMGALYKDWWPLNIMFTLLSITLIIFLIEKERFLSAIILFVLSGFFVEYWWPALVFGVSVWFYVKSPSWLSMLTAVLSCYSFFYINGNHWALVALPIIAVSTFVDIKMIRVKWFFYLYYPLHLFVISFLI